ncbi:SdpI family protein [Oceanobacillus timonensis]|uniref:SdpI family protein n=1 Tax=Oceanobacillus timonensis TaxID=1926285 RepID=UPI0009BBD245|nr:SdpI family protein [Oceanobacillus timonensis]
MLVFLTGLGTLVASIILKISSPDNINSIYGYRTKRSMKNQKLWDFAQKYSAKILIIVGILNILIGIALMFVTYSNEYYLFFELGWAVLSFLPVFVLTERRLIQIELYLTE